MHIHMDSTAEELKDKELKSAMISRLPQGGGVRLYLIYPGKFSGAGGGTSLSFPSDAEAVKWFRERFPESQLKHLP